MPKLQEGFVLTQWKVSMTGTNAALAGLGHGQILLGKYVAAKFIGLPRRMRVALRIMHTDITHH